MRPAEVGSSEIDFSLLDLSSENHEGSFFYSQNECGFRHKNILDKLSSPPSVTVREYSKQQREPHRNQLARAINEQH